MAGETGPGEESERVLLNEEEAKRLFEQTKNSDPFPEIPPALLNSADIHDYIVTTGMVAPYDSSLLKSSSYEVCIGGETIYWDADGRKYDIDLTDGKEVTLEPNSLMFFSTKQTFRLPDYIAIRFNLQINNVHRGLLLGTGPLVDPGFAGKLLIPLHNLTKNEYVFRGGERFIWVEFTKISPHEKWAESNVDEENKTERVGKYTPFDDTKSHLSANEYLQNAVAFRSIQNAIPSALAETQEQAKKAGKYARTVRNVASLAALVVIVTLVNNYIQFQSTISQVNDLVTTVRSELVAHTGSPAFISSNNTLLIELGDKLVALSEAISKAQDLVNDQELMAKQVNLIRDLRQEVAALKAKISELKAKPTPEK